MAAYGPTVAYVASISAVKLEIGVLLFRKML